MTAELDTTHVVRAWLEEGVTSLPDRVLDAVLADVPSTPQRRHPGVLDHPGLGRSMQVRLLVALMTLVLIAVSLAVAAGTLRTATIPRPFDIRPLEQGRYVIDRPFPVRISFDLPAGWEGADMDATSAYVSHVDSDSNPGGLSFTSVDAVYPDPCHWDAASIREIGPGIDSLTAALTTLKGVGVGRVSEESLGGYPSRTFTLDAPASLDGCSTPDDPQFRIWGHPSEHDMSAREQDQIWLTQLGPTRLVVSSQVVPETPPDMARELEGIIASIRFEEFAAIAVPTPLPPPTVVPTPDPEWPLADEGVPLDKTGFYQNVHLYEFDSGGTPHALTRSLAAAFEGQSGWFGADPGIVSDIDGPPHARLAWWSVAKVYLDPCRWQTSALGTADAALMRDRDGLAEALSAWWPPDSNAKASSGYLPAEAAPIVVMAPKLIASFGLAQQIRLVIPSDLDLATCDGGEYRLWEAIDGRSRTAQPGEQIELEINDFEPGIVVIDTATLPSALPSTLDALGAARKSLWLGRVPGRRL